MKTSVIDMKAIEILRELGDGDELLIELIDMYLDDAQTRVEKLTLAVNAQDAAEIEGLAHSLKSSCANLGAMGLSAFCQQLETSARAGDLSEVGGVFAEFLLENEAVNEELKTIAGR